MTTWKTVTELPVILAEIDAAAGVVSSRYNRMDGETQAALMRLFHSLSKLRKQIIARDKGRDIKF